MENMELRFVGSVDLEVHLGHLERACAWAQIVRGRTTQYPDLLREFFEGVGESQEHLFAFFESLEISELYQLWNAKCDLYPGLRENISRTLIKGRLLQQDDLFSPNAARNYAFAYRLAGRLLSAGITVLAVDGIPMKGQRGGWKGDITIQHEGTVLDVQCKRPQKISTLLKNVKEARNQILKEVAPGMGIVAIDASLMIASSELLCVTMPHIAANDVSQSIRSLRSQEVDVVIASDSRIGGMLLVGAKPFRVIQESKIVTRQGTSFRYHFLHSVQEMHAVQNLDSPQGAALNYIHQKLGEWLKTGMPV